MATRLGVSPSRILLLFGETELSPTATPRTLKLGVADIIGERKAGRLEEALATGRGCGERPRRAKLRPGFPILPPTDCVVLASSPEAAGTSQLIQLRVQGKEKHQMLEVSLPRVSGRAGSPCPGLSLVSWWRIKSLSSVVWGSCPSEVVEKAPCSASFPLLLGTWL